MVAIVGVATWRLPLTAALWAALAASATADYMVTVTFEDRTMGPFVQVGGNYRRPMPAPYHMWKGLTPVNGTADGDGLLLHTASDSGVRLRHGDERVGEMRTATFTLATGVVSWESTGSGGWVAVCPASSSLGPSCVSRRQRRRNTIMLADSFNQSSLAALVGVQVYITVVDDRDDGWGFIAFDNLVYPVSGSSSRRLQSEDLGDGSAVVGVAPAPALAPAFPLAQDQWITQAQPTPLAPPPEAAAAASVAVAAAAPETPSAPADLSAAVDPATLAARNEGDGASGAAAASAGAEDAGLSEADDSSPDADDAYM